eukprot:10500458-Ditylum_brightwellii.AAC.1
MEIHQEQPNKQSWQMWRQAMKLWTNTMKLKKLLGRWCKTGANLDQDWPSYFDYNDYVLYIPNTVRTNQLATYLDIQKPLIGHQQQEVFQLRQ